MNKDREILKLTPWELQNLHLPPVTTITLYEGTVPLAYLRERIESMFQLNPWLTARIVKQGTADNVVALAYDRAADIEAAVERCLSVYAPGDVGLTLDGPYEELVRCLLPVQCARSKPATDEDEPLFKVAIVPIEKAASTDTHSRPLQRAMELPGFALVVSMNHTLGDGHTFYKLYGMLSADADVQALDPVRVAGFEEAKTEVIGQQENDMFASAGVGLGIMGTCLGAKMTRRQPQNVCIHVIDPDWVAREKAKAQEAGDVPFISTNDALTSWFFHEMGSDLNIMVANFRGRNPAIQDRADHHAGNYEANVPYFPGDVESPSLIRQSIRSTDGGFRARRAGVPPTGIPGFRKLLRNRTTLITNWATFYHDVILGNEASGNGTAAQRPKLHLPIMERDGIITSVWNNGIIFSPRAGEVGILMITRRFDSDLLGQQSGQGGNDTPIGPRIV